MSSYHRGNDTRPNKHLHHDIRNYRDLAPESLSDEALLDIVRKNGKKDEAIREALAILWNEEPATEWISTDKKKLKKAAPSPPLVERGGRGRGRSAPPGRGEGRGGRGHGGRSASVNTSGRGKDGAPKTSSPAPNQDQVDAKGDTEKVEVKDITEAPINQPRKTSPISVAPVWGSGPSLAEKLREQASAPPPLPPVPPSPPQSAPEEVEPQVEVQMDEPLLSQETPVTTTFAGQSKRSPRGNDAGRGRGRRRAYRDHPHARVETEILAKVESTEQETADNQAVEELNEVIQNVTLKNEENFQAQSESQNSTEAEDNNSHDPVESNMVLLSPVRPSNVPVSEIVGSPVLKMGRWGTPIESSEASPFQFGSFGNLAEGPTAVNADGDESPHKIASGLISSLSESQPTWAQSQLDQNALSQSDRDSSEAVASLSVWGTSQSQTDHSEDTYGYDQQGSNTGDNNAHSAPPGLGLGLGGLDSPAVGSQSSQNKPGNPRNTNRSAPGSQTRKPEIDNMSRQQQYYQPGPPGMGFNMPYYGFDMNSQPASGFGPSATPGSSSPAPGAQNTNSSQTVGSAANQNGSNNSYTNGNANNGPKYSGPPGMPAQMGAPYPPYYGAPYYPQFYYGAGQQNFYGRAGQGMYPPRPYGAEYGPGYEMYGQPGQFGEFGPMSMPPMHPPQGGNDRSGKVNKNSSGQNSQQSAGAVGSAPGTSNAGQGDVNQVVHSAYGMSGYGGYGRPDQGSAWPPYQPWPGMMPFPAAPPSLGTGYSPMGGAPTQPPGNNRQGGSYNSYGRGGGGSSNTPGESNAGIGSTGGTTSNW